MTFRAMVLEEVSRTFPKRNGSEGKEEGLSIRDLSTDGARCTNNLTYLWGKGEGDKWKGKLRDRIVVVSISTLQPGFGGVVKAEGAIVSIEGPDPAGNGSAQVSTAAAKK